MENENKDYCLRVLSPLKKVFPDEEPKYSPEETVFTALHNETISFQLGYIKKTTHIGYGKFSIKSDLADHITVRSVELMPSTYPCHVETDDNYLRTAPGLFPDLLKPLDDGKIIFTGGQWRSLWVDVCIDDSVKSGDYSIEAAILDKEGVALCETSTNVKVYSAVLPKQTLIHTEWFHCDSIADYYKVESWSDAHWQYVENAIEVAGKRGINMILTPIHTPPLDTAIGGEITTVQLVDVTVTNGEYSFGFEKLERFIDICQKHGIEYFEMAHIFTQWGAAFAPKIMATVDGEYKRIFGWESPAVGGDYTKFLQKYLPAVVATLKKLGIFEKSFFHVSDEPGIYCIDSYRAAKESIVPLIDGATLIDALSDYEFYQQGLVLNPIPSNDHVEHFIENGVKHLWTYYCTSQSYEVANRFFSMPSSRNRVLGLQMYKYEIEGFLQWGYNFYSSHESVYKLNPYAITDALNAFPSGDAFLIYPGENGRVEESIRIMVLYNALTDMRALQLLESLTSREHVLSILDENLSEPITFKKYPKNDMYYMQLRNRINKEINENTK